MKRWLLLLLGCAASAACVLWLLRTVDLTAVGQTMRIAGFGAWLAAASVYLLGFLPRALRWQLMLAPSGRFRFGDLFRCIVLGYTGNNLLPFRLGEVVRAVMFNRLTGMSKTTGLASVMAERLLDGFTLVLLLVAVLLGSASVGSTPQSLRPVFFGAALLGGAALVGLAVAWFATDLVVAWATRLSPRIGNIASNGVASVAFLRRPRIFAAVAGISLLVWTIEGMMFVVLAVALHLPAPITVGFLSLTVVNLGILIPAAPGYVGVFQAAAVLAFAVLRRPESEGLAFGILAHSAQFIPLTIFGLVLAIPFSATLAGIARPSPDKPKND